MLLGDINLLVFDAVSVKEVILFFRLGIIEALVFLAASHFLKHKHFIFAILRGPLKQLVLLILLSHIDDVGPVLLILGLKVSKELVE